MSKTISVGVVSTRYWLYMAKVMACQLNEAIKLGEIKADAFPKGVYQEALKFFALVRGGLNYGKTIPDNPPASISAYALASSIIKTIRWSDNLTVNELKEMLIKCDSFVSSLDQKSSLKKDEKDLETAALVRDFFEQLVEVGSNEIYVSNANCISLE